MLLAKGDGGGWQPGIGDPTFVGWLTVAVYFGTAWLCLSANRALLYSAKRSGLPVAWQLRAWWLGLSALLVLLGVNKQLDLQTLFTELGRSLATNQGWYGERKTVQMLFIAAVAGAAVLACAGMMFALRRWLPDLWLGIAGLSLLLGFVLIRAASFHHVDQLLGFEVLGLRFNWIMELGALGLLARCALRNGASPPEWLRPRRRNRLGREEIHVRIRVRSPDSGKD